MRSSREGEELLADTEMKLELPPVQGPGAGNVPGYSTGRGYSFGVCVGAG